MCVCACVCECLFLFLLANHICHKKYHSVSYTCERKVLGTSAIIIVRWISPVICGWKQDITDVLASIFQPYKQLVVPNIGYNIHHKWVCGEVEISWTMYWQQELKSNYISSVLKIVVFLY